MDKIILYCAVFTCFTQVCFGQKKTESPHATESASQSWGGTGQVCNVCHEPFNAKYAVKQTPYFNHQVNAPTFRGNKLDGSPVLIKSEKGTDNCLNCHSSTKTPNYYNGALSKNELDVWQDELLH